MPVVSMPAANRPGLHPSAPMVRSVVIPEKCQERVRVRVIGGIFCIMAEPDTAAAVDDENPGQLTDIPFGNAYAVAPGHGRQPLYGHTDGQEAAQGRLLEMESPEEPLLWIGNHAKGNLKLVFEGCGFLRGSQTDEHHPGTESVKVVFLLTQLRHLIPAEGSPVMAQENQHQRLPQK